MPIRERQREYFDEAVLVLPPARPRIERGLAAARDWLLARQSAEGWWCGELEGDTTLESYWVLVEAFFGRQNSARVASLAHTIRGEVLAGGGWSAYPGGPVNLSVSCLSYFALKIAGDTADAPHMRRSRDAIIELGGAERANTYTKYHLAFFGEYPWERVPAIPPEMILLPRVSPVTINDMSSWSRTIFVPLSIIYAFKPRCVLPAGCSVRELFDTAASAKGGGAPRVFWTTFFELLDKAIKLNERLAASASLRRLAVRKASEWMIERLEDSDGLGAILPAMTNSVFALKCLGYADDHPLVSQGLAHLEGLLLTDPETGWIRVQSCLSPVWDTCLGTYALLQAGLAPDHAAVQRAASWLLSRQCRRRGDWCVRNNAAPGGWYFEFRNEFYPDVDDTCMALIVLQQSSAGERVEAQRAAVERGLEWMLGMQNDDGGWASFDRGVDKKLLTHVPFADHNAMIDPSTADITGRVLECLAQFDGFGPGHPVVDRALRFLRSDQCADGSWYGRWGVNYLYGTWQVLRGLKRIGEDLTKPYVRRAARWLTDHQNGDGGWGESIASYDDPRGKGSGPSTPTQTAWALMGLIAAGDADGHAVRRGIRYLVDTQDADGTWQQEAWVGTGFPKVFYLNYHYYRHYFPLMALAQYHEAVFRK